MKTIDIYTTTQCGFCKQIKALLKEHKLAYSEHDVTASPEALREMQTFTNGALSVPVVVVDKGEKSQGVAVGFDETKELLKIGKSGGGGSQGTAGFANLTCPRCGHKQEAPIPTTSCVPFYVCDWCKETIQADGEDCCVFCSHADQPCPIGSKKSKEGCADGSCTL